MKDQLVQSVTFQWTAMAQGLPNLTNGKVYAKNNIPVQNVEKHILQVWKISWKKYSNYTRAICEKSLEYESITYRPYQKKAEIIKLENEIRLNRQTVYYHESTYDESFITLKEENLKKLLKECKIEPSGIYHYDEEFLHENGINTVRLAIIDAVTNLNYQWSNNLSRRFRSRLCWNLFKILFRRFP